jgi:hypothetical protein
MLMLRLIQRFFSGHVSKTALLIILPLSFASFYCTVIAAAICFPQRYDWRVRVISNLTSPRDNPHFYWLPSLGIVVMALLLFPFAGYLEQRLRAIKPSAARSAGVAFAGSFGVLLLSFVAQLAQPVIGMGWLHEFLARASALAFAVGMFCCCACAVKDRLRIFGGERLLCSALTFSWASLTLLPVVFLAIVAALVLLGHKAGVVWVENFRQSFRNTMFWNLAFWEWAGVVGVTAFLTVSALWLPEPIKTRL